MTLGDVVICINIILLQVSIHAAASRIVDAIREGKK